MKKYIIIITKDQHLITPYIVTDDQEGNPLVFEDKTEAVLYSKEKTGGIVFEYDE